MPPQSAIMYTILHQRRRIKASNGGHRVLNKHHSSIHSRAYMSITRQDCKTGHQRLGLQRYNLITHGDINLELTVGPVRLMNKLRVIKAGCPSYHVMMERPQMYQHKVVPFTPQILPSNKMRPVSPRPPSSTSQQKMEKLPLKVPEYLSKNIGGPRGRKVQVRHPCIHIPLSSSTIKAAKGECQPQATLPRRAMGKSPPTLQASSLQFIMVYGVDPFTGV